MKHIIILIVPLTFLASCNNINPTPKKEFQKILPDTSMIGGKNWEYKMSIDFCNQLNLNTLDKGVDSFEIRWWFPGYFSSNTIFDFRYCNSNGWLANKTTFFYGQNKKTGDQSNKYKIDSSKTENLHPIMDMERIYYTIKAFDIFHVPSQTNIPNFKDNINDGTYLVIEIATKDYYKIISYHCPDAYRNEPNNQKILQIYQFLLTYLGGSFLCFSTSYK
jgi:hypothetical protein